MGDEVQIDIQQVMGPHVDRATSKELVPKFKFDGGNPGIFIREFPVVASAFGVTQIYRWDKQEGDELSEEEEKKNTLAVLVLRNYLSERVLKVIMVGKPKLASTIYALLNTIFLASDARTQTQVTRELQQCEMGIGESLTDFIARINGLMEEPENLGEVFSQQTRMVMVATRLREPWRQQANDKMDRDNDLNYSKLVQHLFLRQRGEAQERSIETYVANVGTTERRDQGGSRGQWSQSGRGDNQWGRGRSNRGRGRGRSRNPGRGISNNTCANCGEEGHWRRTCTNPPRCHICGRSGHMSYDCEENTANMARVSVVDDEGWNRNRESNNGEFLYMATHLFQTLGKEAFLLDGGATVHMVEEWVNLREEKKVNLRVKGVGNMTATGEGILEIGSLELAPVLRVPGLGVNLISEGVLQKRGCEIISRDEWRKVIYKGRVIIQAKLERGLFVWRPNDQSFIKKEQCYLANIKENVSLHLWHLRMGHLNGDSLRSLKNMSEGMPNFGKDALPFCVACCRAKSVVKSFKGNSNRAQKTFDTIYCSISIILIVTQ